jgi:CheY-like chemotaxis protein
MHTLLYIEDSPASLRLIERVVKPYREYNLISAATAEDGIAVAREQQPGLIILDIGLPGMDGFEALRLLREHEATRAIPVIALTAAAKPSDIEKGLMSGFCRYLTKPVDVHEFLDAVRAAVGGGC